MDKTGNRYMSYCIYANNTFISRSVDFPEQYVVGSWCYALSKRGAENSTAIWFGNERKNEFTERNSCILNNSKSVKNNKKEVVL